MSTPMQNMDAPRDEQPLAPLPGLRMLGATDADACVDGACALPADVTPSRPNGGQAGGGR